MKTVNKIMMLILVIQIILFLSSCNKKPTEPGIETKLNLTLEDVSCTEAWIKLTSSNITTGQSTIIQILKNGNVAQTISLLSADTVLYVDSLLPKQSYRIQAKVQISNKPIVSNELNVVTMDTTSHNFSWQSWEFGQHSSSTLYDVAIIDENNIWAVGEIYMLDSLGRPDPNAYNAVHWDGTKWELLRIPYHYNGQNYYSGIRAIYAFNKNDIWFGIASLIRWNGIEYKSIDTSPFFPALINKMWGSSSEDFYIVGNNGNIAHWDGVRWTRIESGTDLRINDIWGDYNEKTGKTEILAIAAELDVNRGSKVLRIEGNSVTEEYNNGLSWDVGGIWFKSGRRYYIAGAGIHQKHYLSDSVWKRYSPGVVTNYVGYGIKGSDINNVFAVGSFLEIVHYNGFSWHNYLNEIFSTVGALSRIAIVENLIVAVGLNGSKAIIFSGKRN
jgi:hypothetical protein